MDITIVKDDEDKPIPYDDAVETGRNLIRAMKDSQFDLGRVADKLEPKYGDETLQHYAEDIGIDYGTLKSYRTTYKAWKDEPVRPRSFSVAKVLNRHPDKADIIQETPELSVKEAEEKMQEWKNERGADGKRRKPSPSKTPSRLEIVREIDAFLSEFSDLTGMIWEITDDPDIDPSDLLQRL